MRRASIIRITCLSVLLYLLSSPVFAQTIETPPIQQIDGRITWVFDYEQGQQLSQTTGKPMFIVFRCER